MNDEIIYCKNPPRIRSIDDVQNNSSIRINYNSRIRIII